MTRTRKSAPWLLGLCALTNLCAASIAFAQPPGPPPGGPGGGPGPGGRPPFGGPMMRRPMMTVANVPVEALEATLALSAEQKSRIAEIQENLREQRRELMPPPPGQGQGPQEFPDPETMRARFEKMRELEQQAVKQIEAVLTDSQRRALPQALREIEALGMAGIPLPLLGELKLTNSQKQRILAIAQKAQEEQRKRMEAAQQSGDFRAAWDGMRRHRQQTIEKTRAVLTGSQRNLLDQFLRERPGPGPGRGFGPPPGGFGPPPGGFGPPPGGFGPPPGEPGPPPPPGA